MELLHQDWIADWLAADSFGQPALPQYAPDHAQQSAEGSAPKSVGRTHLLAELALRIGMQWRPVGWVKGGRSLTPSSGLWTPWLFPVAVIYSCPRNRSWPREQKKCRRMATFYWGCWHSTSLVLPLRRPCSSHSAPLLA